MEINTKQSVTQSLQLIGKEYAASGEISSEDAFKLLSMVEVLLDNDNLPEFMYSRLYRVIGG